MLHKIVGYIRSYVKHPAKKSVVGVKKTVYTKKKRIPASLRKAVWHTYIGVEKGLSVCPCCKIQNISQLEFDCGHVVAEARGGETNLDNLRPVCHTCNLSMGTRDMFEFAKQHFQEFGFQKKKKGRRTCKTI